MSRVHRRSSDPVVAGEHGVAGGPPRVSIVVTVYNEGDAIIECLDRIFEAVRLPCEVLVVFDTPEDTTASYTYEYATRDPRVLPTLNTYGRGPAFAIRYGIDHATAPVVVVTMADGCDDPMQIDPLTKLVERGVVVAAASRYMRSVSAVARSRSPSRTLSTRGG